MTQIKIPHKATDLRAKLRRVIRALSPADARALAQSWHDMGVNDLAARQEWMRAQIGMWSQSMDGLLAVELPRRMRASV